MENIAILEGDDLKRFLEHVQSEIDAGRIYRMRFAVDGGLKMKVNEYVWSPPYGKVTE